MSIVHIITVFVVALGFKALAEQAPKKENSSADKNGYIKARPIMSFDPTDEKLTPELVTRIPIKFKAKAQPMMIGASGSPQPKPGK